MKVLAHALAPGKPIEQADGTVLVSMYCETPDGKISIHRVPFWATDVPKLEAYFKSEEGMVPLELEA